MRAGLADRVNADLLISVHHNAPTPGPSPRPGTEVFIQSTSEASRRLGGLVWTRVMAALSDFDIDWTAAPDAGVLSVLSTRGSDAYGMISGPRTVSVLAELAYISNPPEAELFATNEYVEAASDALADAIEGYLTTEATGAGYVAGPGCSTLSPGSGEPCVSTQRWSRTWSLTIHAIVQLDITWIMGLGTLIPHTGLPAVLAPAGDVSATTARVGRIRLSLTVQPSDRIVSHLDAAT